MKEIFGSIWIHYPIDGHIVCLTINGVVKKNGEAVMGCGNAKQATILMPNIAQTLGQYLRKNGNRAGFLIDALIVFPVKHKWWEKADLDLIRESGQWLFLEAWQHPENTYHLPRPGCGNGRRDYEREVKPMLIDLPDNVWVHHIESEDDRLAH